MPINYSNRHLPGGETAAAPGTVALSSDVAQILAAEIDRKQAVIRNTDAANTAYIGYSSAITTANAPIRVPAGDAWVEDVALTAIWGITAATETATVAQQEVAV